MRATYPYYLVDSLETGQSGVKRYPYGAITPSIPCKVDVQRNCKFLNSFYVSRVINEINDSINK